MKLEHFEEQIFFATIRIEALNPSRGLSSVGTGCLFQHPLPDQSPQSILVLVTCRHVLFEGKGLVTLAFHRRDPTNSTKPVLGDPIVIDKATHEGAYWAHDAPAVDVAAINVSQIIGQRPEITAVRLKVE